MASLLGQPQQDLGRNLLEDLTEMGWIVGHDGLTIVPCRRVTRCSCQRRIVGDLLEKVKINAVAHTDGINDYSGIPHLIRDLDSSKLGLSSNLCAHEGLH